MYLVIMTNQEILLKYGIEISDQEIKENNDKHVICGMSGGVDSSVSALVLKLMGFKVSGIFMRNWDEIDEHGVCSAENDYQDVIAVCENLNIPYYSIDFSKEYKDQVFSHFLAEYEKGYTPNPDILCNREIKFKVFFDKAMELGADYLATGHYCQTDGSQLIKGNDASKDQSYFLYAINGEVLKKVLFPIGALEKTKVRQIAKVFNLATMSKKDSTGICFIGERNFKEFLAQYLKSQKGNFVHLETKKVLKSHDGACFYTKGQRKGLGIGGPGGPFFVVDKDIESNTVYVAEGEDHPALYATELFANDLTWIKECPDFPLKCHAKVRYRQADQECTVYKIGDEEIKVVFNTPQRAITERQSVVLYHNNICLGGGVIKAVGKSLYLTNNEDRLNLSSLQHSESVSL
jgi:tRNA-specific 2-thiouridylase